MASQEQTIKEVDLERIIREKMGPKSRFIPRFIINLLKRIIRQEFINVYLRRGYVGVDFCKHGVEYLGATVVVEGRENLPTDGRFYTFVSNHPLGAVDGVTLGWIIGEQYDGKIKYLVNDLLMNLQGLAPLCVPINKLGRQARNFPAMVESAFSGENHVVMFPAGLCSRKMDDGQIRDIPWSKTFITKSVHYQRDVVPIHFEGQLSDRFYRLARFCQKWHLPNFAQVLLPDEMTRCNGKTYTVKIGKPIPWQTFDKTHTPLQWAQWVQNKVYEL
jgi:putative hemolysin